MKVIKTEYFDQQRRIVAAVTSDSWKNIPHVAYMYEPDVTELFAEYKTLNRNREGQDKITFNTLMLKIIATGVKASPIMNSHIFYKHRYVSGRIETMENVNAGIPVILPNGKMMTVSIKNIESKNLDELTADINDMQRRAQNTNLEQALFEGSFKQTIKNLKEGAIVQTVLRLMGTKFGKCKVDTLLKGKAKKEYYTIPESERLTGNDIEPGTITVSNVGSLYLEQKGATALLEIVPPQVSAFSVGAVMDKPVVVDGEDGKKEIAIRKVLPICIAFDHRALDFGETVPFMKTLDEIFANPKIIHKWESEAFAHEDENEALYKLKKVSE